MSVVIKITGREDIVISDEDVDTFIESISNPAPVPDNVKSMIIDAPQKIKLTRLVSSYFGLETDNLEYAEGGIHEPGYGLEAEDE